MGRQAVIVGAGPAGISAAIYLIRAGIPVTVIYRDMGALGKTEAIENYYGFPEPVSGPELFNRGIDQARRLGVDVVQDEVVGLGWEETMTVIANHKTYPADVIILATGAARIAPKIEGLREFEGRGVSYCAVCDAFFYRQKDVAVIGHGEYALHEAMELTATSKSVTIFTLGKDPEFELPKNVQNLTVDRRKIVKLSGKGGLESIALDDGTERPMDGLFVAVGVAGSADLARKIGAETDGVKIVVDDKKTTTIPGVYACGDCTGGLLQVAKAVYDGALAATDAVKYLRNM